MKKEIKDVLINLESHGFLAYVVGGYVRNRLLGKTSSDIDIITNARVKDIVLIFKDNVKKTGDYGTAKILINNVSFDVATFRKEERYENNKPKDITYVDDLYTDLLRRDFTINTICMDKNEKIIDLLDAYQDLERNMIYTVGDVSIKFKEDKTRLLRAIRFMVTLNLKLSKDIDDYISNNKEDFLDIPYSIKKEEIDKIFTSKNYLEFIKYIKKYELEDYIGFKTSSLIKTSSTLGMWAQLNYDERFPFTRIEKNQINKIRELISKKAISKYDIYLYGNYIAGIAGSILKISTNKINSIYMKLPIKSIKDIDISAKDIINILDLKESSQISIILKNIEKEIINGTIKNIRSDIEKYLLKRK
ncbi:MAG: hypothetical protein RR228_01275 [Bacilli bacterium]